MEIVYEIKMQIDKLRYNRQKPKYVILDINTWKTLRADPSMKEYIGYSYEQPNPDSSDKICGVDIAVVPDYLRKVVQVVGEPDRQDYFEEQYLNSWQTNYEKVNVCGECGDFGPKGCVSSHIEAKYGSKNTPACEDFRPVNG